MTTVSAPDFLQYVDAFVFATADPLAAVGGIEQLRKYGIRPLAISGLISQSPLAMREATEATGIRCITAKQLQAGELNSEILELEPPVPSVRLIPLQHHRTASLR